MKSAILRGVMSVSFARSPKYLQEPPTVAHRAQASLLHKVVDLARLGDIASRSEARCRMRRRSCGTGSNGAAPFSRTETWPSTRRNVCGVPTQVIEICTRRPTAGRR